MGSTPSGNDLSVVAQISPLSLPLSLSPFLSLSLSMANR